MAIAQTVAHTDTGFALTLHRGFATVVLIYSATLALWGLFQYLRGANPSGGYLGALIIDEGVMVFQGLVGLALLIGGHRPQDILHYVYGIVAVLTLPIAYTYSNRGHSRRDSLIFGIATLFLVGIAIRGTMTGAGY